MILGGIDAGGSATKCILLNEKKELIAECQTGPANYQAGVMTTIREIKLAIEEACRIAGVEFIDALGIGLAGAGRNSELRNIQRELASLKNTKMTFVTNDGEIAVLGAHGGKPGIVLIAGTGSIAYGLRKNGTVVRSGGWGSILGDEGSGYWIGLQSLKASIRAGEGRGKPTLLSEAIKNKLGTKDPGELLPIVFKQDLGRKEVASLVPVVVETMLSGDKIALKIIKTGIRELLLLVQSALKEIDFQPETAAVTGGLFQNKTLADLFAVKLEEAAGLRTTKPLYPAVYGAVLYAASRSGFDFLR